MSRILIREAAPSDHDAMYALNLSNVRHTSSMDMSRLQELIFLSCYHRVVCVDDVVSGLLFAMRADAPYRNDNFAWFSRIFDDFLYVDRIVIADASRGLRLGSLLYESLFCYAREHGIARVTCEINVIPSNEASRRFHEKLGFRELGTQWIADGTKQVSLQSAESPFQLSKERACPISNSPS